MRVSPASLGARCPLSCRLPDTAPLRSQRASSSPTAWTTAATCWCTRPAAGQPLHHGGQPRPRPASRACRWTSTAGRRSSSAAASSVASLAGTVRRPGKPSVLRKQVRVQSEAAHGRVCGESGHSWCEGRGSVSLNQKARNSFSDKLREIRAGWSNGLEREREGGGEQ